MKKMISSTLLLCVLWGGNVFSAPPLITPNPMIRSNWFFLPIVTIIVVARSELALDNTTTFTISPPDSIYPLITVVDEHTNTLVSFLLVMPGWLDTSSSVIYRMSVGNKYLAISVPVHLF